MQNIPAISEFNPKEADGDDIQDYISLLQETYTAYAVTQSNMPLEYSLWVNEKGDGDFPVIRANGSARVMYNSKYNDDEGLHLDREFFMQLGAAIHEAISFLPTVFFDSRFEECLEENFEQGYEQALAGVLVPKCAYEPYIAPELRPFAKLGQCFSKLTVPAVEEHSETPLEESHPHTSQETLSSEQRQPLFDEYYDNLPDSGLDTSEFASKLSSTYKYEIVEEEQECVAVNIWQCANSSHWNYPIAQIQAPAVNITYSRTDDRELTRLPEELLNVLPCFAQMAEEADSPEQYAREPLPAKFQEKLNPYPEKLEAVGRSLGYLFVNGDPQQELSPLSQWVSHHLSNSET